MSKLKYIAYSLFGVFMIIILLLVYIAFLGSKQVIYNLSVMPRAQALAYVQNIYIQNKEVLAEQGFYINPAAIEQILDNYLDEATKLRWYENAVLSLEGYFEIVKWAVAGVIIVAGIIYELVGASGDGYKRVIHQD